MTNNEKYLAPPIAAMSPKKTLLAFPAGKKNTPPPAARTIEERATPNFGVPLSSIGHLRALPGHLAALSGYLRALA